MLPIFTETAAEAGMSRVEVARRRAREGYYDRPEVRRVLAHRILRRLSAHPDRGRPTHPGAPESP